VLIDILHESDRWIAVNKPAGCIVHRSSLAGDDAPDLLRALRDQLGQYLYPVHRLDRPTSGVILFAKDSEYAATLQSTLQQATKQYVLVCRGHIDKPSVIDHPLKKIFDSPSDKRKRKRGLIQTAEPQDAITHYQPIANLTLDVCVDRYPTTRYALVSATIDTGRRHQIRRHFKHISHPIIGCPKYGKSIHNRFFQETYGIGRLLLHAASLELTTEIDGRIKIDAQPDQQFARALSLFSEQSCD